MAPNRLFVSASLLDEWVTGGAAELGDGELRLRGAGGSYAVEEAAHIVAEVTGVAPAHALVGSVHSVAELSVLGAEVLDRSLVLGDLAFDVVPGFLASPSGQAGGRVRTVLALGALAAVAGPPSPAPPSTDEELLARYLIEKL